MEPNVSVELGLDSGTPVYAIKLSSPHYEVNVRVPVRDLAKLRQARTTPWLEGSLRIGESAGSSVFWSVGEDGRVSILIGQDDETWDIGILVSITTFEVILREVEALARAQESPGSR